MKDNQKNTSNYLYVRASQYETRNNSGGLLLWFTTCLWKSSILRNIIVLNFLQVLIWLIFHWLWLWTCGTFFLCHIWFNVTMDIVWIEYLTKGGNLIPDRQTQVTLCGDDVNRFPDQSSSHQFQSEWRFSRWFLAAAKLVNYSASK